jgi:hypothetical protein
MDPIGKTCGTPDEKNCCTDFLKKFCMFVFQLQEPAVLLWLIICLSQNLQFVPSFLNRSPPWCLRAQGSCSTAFCAESSSILLFLVTLSGKTSDRRGIIPHTFAEDRISIKVVLIAISQSFVCDAKKFKIVS